MDDKIYKATTKRIEIVYHLQTNSQRKILVEGNIKSIQMNMRKKREKQREERQHTQKTQSKIILVN